jgi:dihydrodipicolinate reductase
MKIEVLIQWFPAITRTMVNFFSTKFKAELFEYHHYEVIPLLSGTANNMDDGTPLYVP